MNGIQMKSLSEFGYSVKDLKTHTNFLENNIDYVRTNIKFQKNVIPTSLKESKISPSKEEVKLVHSNIVNQTRS